MGKYKIGKRIDWKLWDRKLLEWIWLSMKIGDEKGQWVGMGWER